MSDQGSQTIRVVDVTNGAVTTLAGTVDMPGTDDGAAASAKFNQPSDLVLASNALFVNNQVSGHIRKIALDTKMVSTLKTGIFTPALAPGRRQPAGDQPAPRSSTPRAATSPPS